MKQTISISLEHYQIRMLKELQMSSLLNVSTYIADMIETKWKQKEYDKAFRQGTLKGLEDEKLDAYIDSWIETAYENFKNKVK